MLSFLYALSLLSFVAIGPLYVMAFTALHDFGKGFQRLHPHLYTRLIGADPPSFLSPGRTTKLFRAIQSGKDLGEPISPDLLAIYRSTRKYVVAALTCFMVLLFSLLIADAITDYSLPPFARAVFDLTDCQEGSPEEVARLLHDHMARGVA